MTAVPRPRSTLTRLVAVGIAVGVWAISWSVALFTATSALIVAAWRWKDDSLLVVAFALLTVVITFGGPIAGLRLGRLIWRRGHAPGSP
jgi:CBS domain containing-hemolysin-like protein